MKNHKKSLISFVLIISMLITLVSCSADKQSVEDKKKNEANLELEASDLMSTVTANDRPMAETLKESSEVFTDFAVELFKQSEKKGENTLISPLSVLCALSMTANGAKGKTLEEMESVLGMSVDELNEYVHSYMNILPSTENYKLSLANSVWFTSDKRFSVNKDFLQTNADYYGADVYQAPFDEGTKNDINNWVNDKTDGMIEDIIDEIPPEALMYLVNALAFDAKWEEIYKKHQIGNNIFTTEEGETQETEFMYSEESIYLEDENAQGFVKYYKDRKYAFAALLPNEGVSVSDYIASLDGKKLHDMLTYSKNVMVNAAMPRFESEFDIEMSEVLKGMGMPTAFADAADFSGLGTSSAGPIYINRVLHKTFISVDESGTKAGAVTAVEMVDECCPVYEEIKTVHLDRPFVYMLIDCETNIPFFIGSMMDISK